MKDLLNTIRANIRETLRGAENAELKGRSYLARALRQEAYALAQQHDIHLDAVDGTRDKDWRRKLWERKKGNKSRYWRDKA